MASFSGTPKCRNTRALNSRSTSIGNSFVSTSAIFLYMLALRWQALAARFLTKRNQQQANGERNGRHCDRNSQGLIVLHTRAHEKGNPRTSKSRERSGKSKRACAALRRILLR